MTAEAGRPTRWASTHFPSALPDPSALPGSGCDAGVDVLRWRRCLRVQPPSPSRRGPARPRLVVVRHGATEWSRSGRHTGRTDLPAARRGRDQAAELGRRLAGHRFDLVLTSPLARARETAELAGFGPEAQVCEDLREWDYGDYEGCTTDDIREQRPGWSLWGDGAPGGESAAEVGPRADRVIAMVRQPGRGRARLRPRPPAAGGGGPVGGARARGGGAVHAWRPPA